MAISIKTCDLQNCGARFTWDDSADASSDPLCTRNPKGSKEFKNPFCSAAKVTVEGEVDDDVTINGVVQQPTCCIYDCGLNGRHRFKFERPVTAGEKLTFGYNSNHRRAAFINLIVTYRISPP
jgi:hypothetical protein